MRLVQTFALVALLPAALNASPANARAGAPGGLSVPLCTGDGAPRTIRVPIGKSDIPGSDMPGCCAKGCQSGGARKKGQGCCDEDGE